MYLRANFRIKQRQFFQWIIKTFMPDLHHAYLRLLRERNDLYALLQSSRSEGVKDRQKVKLLWTERTELTEALMGLIAKDDEGFWTTVFDADTRLPAETCALLDELVSRA